MTLALLSKTSRSYIESQSRSDRTATGPRVAAALGPPLIQAKLKIGEPNDKFEQEADRVAEMVMRMPDSTVANRAISAESSVGARIQRMCPVRMLTSCYEQE